MWIAVALLVTKVYIWSTQVKMGSHNSKPYSSQIQAASFKFYNRTSKFPLWPLVLTVLVKGKNYSRLLIVWWILKQHKKWLKLGRLIPHQQRDMYYSPSGFYKCELCNTLEGTIVLECIQQKVFYVSFCFHSCFLVPVLLSLFLPVFPCPYYGMRILSLDAIVSYLKIQTSYLKIP